MLIVKVPLNSFVEELEKATLKRILRDCIAAQDELAKQNREKDAVLQQPLGAPESSVGFSGFMVMFMVPLAFFEGSGLWMWDVQFSFVDSSVQGVGDYGLGLQPVIWVKVGLRKTFF